MIETKYLLIILLSIFLFSYFQGYLNNIQIFLRGKDLPYRSSGIISTKSFEKTSVDDKEWITKEIEKNVDQLEKDSKQTYFELRKNYNKEEEDRKNESNLKWEKVSHMWKKLNPFSKKEIEKFTERYQGREGIGIGTLVGGAGDSKLAVKCVDTNDPLGKNYTKKQANVHFNQESFVPNCDEIFDDSLINEHDNIPIEFTHAKKEGMYNLDWLDGYNVKENNIFESRNNIAFH